MGEEPERLRAREIGFQVSRWMSDPSIPDSALPASPDDVLWLLAEVERLAGELAHRTHLHYLAEIDARDSRAECERRAGRVAAATEALPDGALVMRCASGVASTDEGHALIGAFQAVRAALDVGGSE